MWEWERVIRLRVSSAQQDTMVSGVSCHAEHEASNIYHNKYILNTIFVKELLFIKLPRYNYHL